MQKKTLLLVAACVSLLAFGSVVFLALRNRTKSAEAQREAAMRAEADARAEQDREAAQGRRERQRLAQQNEELTRLATSLRQAGAAPRTNEPASPLPGAARAGSTPGPAAESGAPGGMAAVMQKMMQDPAMREMVRSQQKAMMAQMYAPLFQELQLTAEQREKFMGLVIDNAMSSVAQAGNVLQGQGADRAEALKSIQERQKEMNEGVRNLLGEANYARYEEYQKTLGERTQLNLFRQQMAGGEAPLQDEQVGQLMQILAEEKARVPSVLASGPGGAGQNLSALSSPETMNQHFEWQEDLNRRVLERAKGTLTSRQLSDFDGFLRQQLDMQKLGIRMARDLFGGPRTGAEGGAVPAPEVVPIPSK